MKSFLFRLVCVLRVQHCWQCRRRRSRQPAMPNTSLAAASCADATSRDALVRCVSDGLSGLIARSRAGCVIDGHGGFGFGNQIEIALSNWLIAAGSGRQLAVRSPLVRATFALPPYVRLACDGVRVGSVGPKPNERCTRRTRGRPSRASSRPSTAATSQPEAW